MLLSARVVLLVALSAMAMGALDKKADPRETWETAIPEAIRLLEAKEHVAFLKNFVPPEELKAITEKSSIEEFAKKFGERKADRLLEVLKKAKDAKPTIDMDGKRADFGALAEGMKSFKLIKIGDYWYVAN